AVEEGGLLCLVGRAGGGKSPLLNIIGGFEAATSGSVAIDGEEVKGPDRRRVFVFQEYGIFPWATVWDNVALGLRGRPAAEQARIVRRYVDLVGLAGFEHSYPPAPSGGLKQRVAVARALAGSPTRTSMAAPVGALDP